MARKLRVEYPGAIYDTNRGDHREPIFQDNDDRREFLRTLAETIAARLHMGARGHLTHLLYRQAHTAGDNPNQSHLWK